MDLLALRWGADRPVSDMEWDYAREKGERGPDRTWCLACRAVLLVIAVASAVIAMSADQIGRYRSSPYHRPGELSRMIRSKISRQRRELLAACRQRRLC
jgi:hypothetical protein